MHIKKAGNGIFPFFLLANVDDIRPQLALSIGIHPEFGRDITFTNTNDIINQIGKNEARLLTYSILKQ